MKFPEHFTTIDKLNNLERRVLIHCFAYYELDENFISDEEFNKLARLLAKKVQRYQGTKTLKKTMYGYVFEDYTDGSTGFDLISKLKKKDKQYIEQLARYGVYLKNHKRRKKR